MLGTAMLKLNACLFHAREFQNYSLIQGPLIPKHVDVAIPLKPFHTGCKASSHTCLTPDDNFPNTVSYSSKIGLLEIQHMAIAVARM